MEAHLRRESWAAALSLGLATSVWLLLAKKDFSWDLFNHQLYLPFSLLTGRFATDLLAAGPQSYQNAIGYLPMYWLATSKLPAIAVGLALALGSTAAQAWALLRIGQQVFGGARGAREWRLLALAMAFAAPVHLLIVGSTANDSLCAALSLVAFALVLNPTASARSVAVAGIVTGLSIAIKPTSLVFAIPTVLLAASHVIGKRWPNRRLWTGVLWAVLTFALTGGLWAAWLWRHFGNPIYPLLNQVFQSPFAPNGAIVGTRFLPQESFGWLLLPFQMVQFKSYVTVEGFAPDARPALALLATLAVALKASWRYGLRRWFSGSTWARADVQLVLFLALTYGLWMLTSGNARYAAAWFLLAGLMLVRAVQLLSTARAAAMGLLMLLCVQFYAFAGTGGQFRLMGSQPWNADAYIRLEVPNALVESPFLHLSLGIQSYAGLAHYLNPEGAFINLRGQMSIPNEGPLAERLKQQLIRWRGRTRFLFAPRFNPDTSAFGAAVAADNWLLSRRYGLRIDPRDCHMIRILGFSPEPNAQVEQTAETKSENTSARRVLSCAAVEDKVIDPQFERDLVNADRVFDLLEADCPIAFGPRPMTTEAAPNTFWRTYMNSSAVIEISEANGVMASYHRAMDPIYLGTPEQVIQNRGKDACTAWKKLLSQ